MKPSYKLSLLASAAVLVLVVGYYATRDKTAAPQAADAQETLTDPAPSRQTLRNDTPGDGSFASMLQGQPDSDNPQATPSDLATELRAMVRAAQENDDPTNDAEVDTAQAPPLGNGASGGIALVRTGHTALAEVNGEQVPTLRIGQADDRPNVPWPGKDDPPTGPAELNDKTPVARTYTVKHGDTLSSIAIELYDNARTWVGIAQANPNVDPIKLRVGQTLKLPSARDLLRADEPAAAAPGNTVAYTILPGDSLSTIAKQFYGDPTQWRYIFNANRIPIGDNPNNIQAGMDLKIPPAPQGAQ